MRSPHSPSSRTAAMILPASVDGDHRPTASRRPRSFALRHRALPCAVRDSVARPFGSLIRFQQWPPVNTHPRFHIVGKPDLALGKVGNGLREVASHGDLVRPLSADSTKPYPDLMGTHEMESHAHHTHDYRHPTILEPRGRHASVSRNDHGALACGAMMV